MRYLFRKLRKAITNALCIFALINAFSCEASQKPNLRIFVDPPCKVEPVENTIIHMAGKIPDNLGIDETRYAITFDSIRLALTNSNDGSARRSKIVKTLQSKFRGMYKKLENSVKLFSEFQTTINRASISYEMDSDADIRQNILDLAISSIKNSAFCELITTFLVALKYRKYEAIAIMSPGSSNFYRKKHISIILDTTYLRSYAELSGLRTGLPSINLKFNPSEFHTWRRRYILADVLKNATMLLLGIHSVFGPRISNSSKTIIMDDIYATQCGERDKLLEQIQLNLGVGQGTYDYDKARHVSRVLLYLLMRTHPLRRQTHAQMFEWLARHDQTHDEESFIGAVNYFVSLVSESLILIPNEDEIASSLNIFFVRDTLYVNTLTGVGVDEVSDLIKYFNFSMKRSVINEVRQMRALVYELFNRGVIADSEGGANIEHALPIDETERRLVQQMVEMILKSILSRAKHTKMFSTSICNFAIKNQSLATYHNAPQSICCTIQ